MMGGLILLFAFTNCDSYSEQLQQPSQSNVACLDDPDGEDCVRGNKDLLELRINSGSEVKIYANEVEVNVGGDCNEGGFPDNLIRWEVRPEGGGQVLSSSGSQRLDGKCVNGRYNILVRLPGSLSVGQRLLLSVELVGRDDQGNLVYNTVVAKKQAYIRGS
jgi:hypothetical protein